MTRGDAEWARRVLVISDELSLASRRGHRAIVQRAVVELARMAQEMAKAISSGDTKDDASRTKGAERKGEGESAALSGGEVDSADGAGGGCACHHRPCGAHAEAL